MFTKMENCISRTCAVYGQRPEGGYGAGLINSDGSLELYRSKVQFHRKIGGKKQTVSFKSLVVLAYLPRILLQPKNRVYRRLLAKLPGM